MPLFSTYYKNIPIEFDSSKNELYEVRKVLLHPIVENFFEQVDRKTFICGEKINDKRYINQYFRDVNSNLEEGDYFFGFFETYQIRKARTILGKWRFLNNIYFFFVFLFQRVLPKIRFLNLFYFAITKGKDRLVSKAEILGRLVSQGFDIERIETLAGYNYFLAKKIKAGGKVQRNYGLIFKMKRVGKKEKLFYIYKFRTMHPFSEFLQEYMVTKNGLGAQGKIARDFRITPWGAFLRKYWLDEFPQVLNILKGQMKLVGLRPVSASYYKNLPEDIKEGHRKFKPGCIPPYVAFNYKSSYEDVIEAERLYIKMKTAKPYFTDTKLFFLALVNIFFRGKRSA